MTVPFDGVKSPAAILSTADLPHPVGPTTLTNSPSPIVKLYFVQLYHGQYSEERLVRALSGVHPMELYRVSRDNPAKLPGWRRYVYPIYTTYNGKCRKDALPMKF